MLDQNPPLGASARPGLSTVEPREAGAEADLRTRLRQLGGLAHQAQAATRAADHFIATDADDDRNTGSWLMACAVDLSSELAVELDGLGRQLRNAPGDDPLAQRVQDLRKRAHKLQAAVRAADHFLDQELRVDRDTGCWLTACAMNLAQALAAALDDSVAPSGAAQGAAARQMPDPHDVALVRRVTAAGPQRGAA